MDQPNVVLFTCHDLGDAISPYGVPVCTPNLERMAAEGIVMQNHFSTGSVCSPARGSLMTGCYAHTHGLMGLTHRGWALDVESCPPLPKLLADIGFETHLFGLQHEHPDPARLGYGEVHAPAGPCYAEKVVPLFADWLRRRRAGGKPFLAAIGVHEAHRMGLQPSHFRRDVYRPPDPAQVEVPPYLPDLPEVREDLAGFYGAANWADRAFGEVLDALDETGCAGDTLLIFTADHGASFMHAKGTLYDGGTKVALLLRMPGSIAAGRRTDALTSHVDVVPTIFDFMGLTLPFQVEGASFAPVARGAAAQGRLYVAAEKNYTNFYDPARMVRSRHFKYIRKGLRTCVFDFVIPEIEQCPCGFRQNRRIFDFYPARRCMEELYDLRRDPGEMENVLENPQHRETLSELRAALDKHLIRTGDPFGHLRNDLLMPEDGYERTRDRGRN
jgi:N-sulfoglucosamine sulfohydrolase